MTTAQEAPVRPAAQAEPARLCQSTPPWLAKRRSSDASTASRTDGAMRASGTQSSRRTAKSTRTVCSSRPLRSRSHASLGCQAARVSW